MLTPTRNLGGSVRCKIAGNSSNAGAPVLVTAAGTGDNTKVTGTTVDRKGTTGGTLADSCVLAIGWVAALTNAKSLAFAVEIQDSADDSTWNTAVVLQASTVAKLAGSSTNFSGTVELDVNLAPYARYVRFNITPDLSASGTDTATYSAVCVLGGHQTSGDAA